MGMIALVLHSKDSNEYVSPYGIEIAMTQRSGIVNK